MQACNYSSMLHKKRLRRRSLSMYRGPLSKMIDEAVEERMAALKNTEATEEAAAETTSEATGGIKLPHETDEVKDSDLDFVDGKYQGDAKLHYASIPGRSEHVKFDRDAIQLPDSHYQDMGFESRDAYRREYGQSQVDIEENRQASNAFYNSAEKVKMDDLSDAQKQALTDMYGKNVDGLEIYQKDGKFYFDQGEFYTNEKQFTTPIEITDPAFQVKDQAVTKESGEQQVSQGGNAVTVAQLFNVNPDSVTTTSQDRQLLMQFSESNPSFAWMQDEKKMKKARSAYEKFKKRANTDRDKNMTFFDYAMNKLDKKIHGGDKNTLKASAKTWESKNKPGKDGGSGEGLQGGAKTSTTSTYVKDKGSWRDSVRIPGEQQPPTNKLKYSNPQHPLNKRTMSFRRKR